MLSKVLKKRDIVTILYASCTFKMLMLLYILESQKYIAEKHETFSIFAKFETLQTLYYLVNKLTFACFAGVNTNDVYDALKNVRNNISSKSNLGNK